MIEGRVDTCTTVRKGSHPVHIWTTRSVKSCFYASRPYRQAFPKAWAAGWGHSFARVLVARLKRILQRHGQYSALPCRNGPKRQSFGWHVFPLHQLPSTQLSLGNLTHLTPVGGGPVQGLLQVPSMFATHGARRAPVCQVGRCGVENPVLQGPLLSSPEPALRTYCSPADCAASAEDYSAREIDLLAALPCTGSFRRPIAWLVYLNGVRPGMLKLSSRFRLLSYLMMEKPMRSCALL